MTWLLSGPNHRLCFWSGHIWLITFGLFLLIAVVNLEGAPCSPAVSGLVGWWPGDGNSRDVVGANNGTLFAGANVDVTGVVGRGFGFDGTGSYVSIPDSPSLRPAEFTVECWVWFDALDSVGSGGSPAGQQYIVLKQNTGNYQAFDLEKVRTPTGDVFSFIVAQPSGVSVEVRSSTVISTGVWYHLAGVRLPASIQLYVNGVMQREAPVSFAQTYGPYPLLFGTTGQAWWDHKLRGRLDEVSLYNRALTPAEMAAIFAAGAAGKCKEVIITDQPGSQSVIVGTNASFQVSATGLASLSYQWRFNGVNLGGATTTRLDLPAVQSASAGLYDVVISNNVNVLTSALATLTVWTPPVITSQPQSRIHVAGTTATFSVAASGAPTPGYQWRFNGAPLIGATASTLTLVGVQPSDAGAYQAVATNIAGSATSQVATLTVWAPPLITLQPQSRTNLAGTTTTFTASASGTPPPSFQWRFNGDPIPGATGASLTLNDLWDGDAGSYVVVAANAAGAVTSSVATLTIWTPPLITLQPQSRTNLTGTTATFTASASGTPPPSFQWRFNGAPLPGATGTSLTLNDLWDEDAGSYVMVAANAAGEVTSSVATLTVWTPPEIFEHPRDLTNAPGTAAYFSAFAIGTEPITYQWQFNGTPIPGATDTFLLLQDVQINDAGQYAMVAANIAGSATSLVATLYLLSPPSITSDPQSRTNVAGTTAFFSVEAVGTPPLFYEWYHNDDLLPDATEATLILNNVQPADAGNYQVVVANQSGTAVSEIATLTILTAPVITAQPVNQTNLPCSTAVFSVNAMGTPPLGYSWQFDGQPVPDATTSTLVIGSVQPYHAGQYRAAVSNVAGVTLSAPATLMVLAQDQVYFSDPQLEAAVRSALNEWDCTVSRTDMLRLTNLWAVEFGITNLSALTNALNLTNAFLAHNAISDLEPLRPLTRLVSLDLSDNSASDLSALAALTNLAVLELTANPIHDASALISLSRLQTLVLNSTSVTNLQFVQALRNLTSLSVFQTGLTDVSPLVGSPNLVWLDLRWNPLTDPSLLTNLSSLRSLHLAGTGLTNCAFLTRLSGLDLLNLSDNHLADISPVANVTNLSYLALSGNRISDYSALTLLPRLQNLELRGNALTNIAFLSSLRLNFVDLADNAIRDVSPLAANTDLALVLDGNTTLNPASLASLQGATGLWLKECSLTNLNSLQGLPRLTALGIEANPLLNLAPLAALNSLEHLAIGRVPSASYDFLTGLTNLSGLRVDDNELTSDLADFSGLHRLRFLSLCENLLPNASALAGLTNLSSLYLWQNRLTNIAGLAGLTNLAFLNVGRNLLDLQTGSPASQVLAQLRQRPSEIRFVPTNRPPEITLSVATAPDWYISANLTSHLELQISDDLLPSDQFELLASSSQQNLVSDSSLRFDPSALSTTLSVTPVPGQIGSTYLTLTAREPGGLSLITNLYTHVKLPTNVVMEANLSNVVAQAVHKPGQWITTVDLLGLTRLVGNNRNLSDLSGLQYASNLATLNLSRNSISNLVPLQQLRALSSLSLFGNRLTTISSLAGLASLRELDLSLNPITNYAVLSGLTGLEVLSLNGNTVPNLNFLATLTSLSSLSVATNRLTDLWPLPLLTNLTSLSVEQNRFTDMLPLLDLLYLDFLDLRYNLFFDYFDPVLDEFRRRGVEVMFFPQREPPLIDARTNWIVPAGSIASLPFMVLDTGPADEPLAVSAAPSGNIAVALQRTGGGTNDAYWKLWATNNLAPNASATVTLRATNDVGLSSSMQLALVATVWLPINAPLLGNLPWNTGGSYPWFGQPSTPLDSASAQSGAIGNLQSSWLLTTVTGPGRLTFWWKVSSQTNEDYLEFVVDRQTNHISGEVDWTKVVANVPPGEQTLLWRYHKDESLSAGLDAGWVDQVVFEPGIWLDILGAPANNQVELALHGFPNRIYAVLVATNLAAWTNPSDWTILEPLIVSTNTTTSYTDTSAGSPIRLYSLQDASPNFESVTRLPNGAMQLVIRNLSGLPYVIEASDLFEEWSPIATNPGIMPQATNVDSAAIDAPLRFYRTHAVVP